MQAGHESYYRDNDKCGNRNSAESIFHWYCVTRLFSDDIKGDYAERSAWYSSLTSLLKSRELWLHFLTNPFAKHCNSKQCIAKDDRIVRWEELVTGNNTYSPANSAVIRVETITNTSALHLSKWAWLGSHRFISRFLAVRWFSDCGCLVASRREIALFFHDDLQ